jgi:hypothetical protein
MSTDTANYSSRDWERLTALWEIRMYTVHPWNGEAVDQGGASINSTDQILPFRERKWDIAAERILEKRAELWERLADL